MKPDKDTPDHLSYRADIDGLRAVAILSVLGFHAFPAWAPGGFVGVDVFFVISGFLISGILLGQLQAGHFSIAGFYGRRIRRIFPALILVLLAALATGFWFLWPGEYRQLGKHAAGGAGFVVNAMLWREAGYFDGSGETKPLLHLWSLGVEEQFYIFWPLMLAAAWKAKRHAGVLIAVVMAASFAVNIWLVDRSEIVNFYSPVSRFWELLAGGALAWGMRNGSLRAMSRLKADIFSTAGLAAIGVGIFALDKDMQFPGWLALLPVCGACLIIAAGEKAFVNRLLALRAMVAIGLISYPLYLWHWPLLSFAQILSGEAPARYLRIAMVALSFLLAALTYHLVEKPIRKRAPSRRLIGGLAAAMIVCAGAGAMIWAGNGLPQRYADGGTISAALDGDRLIATWQHNVRMHECHIQDDDDVRAPECVESRRPLLLLWGDSHAAAFYPGLKKLQETHKFGIAQMTQAGCPPMFGVQHLTFRKNCPAINRRILSDAARLRPSVILLAGAWHHHDYPMEDADIIARTAETVALIEKEVPGAKVIVIGPEPRWLSPLPAIYRRAITIDKHTPPKYASQHLDPALLKLDAEMGPALAAKGDAYLSPKDKLCNRSGCLTRLGDGLDSLTFIDEEHVTVVGSDFLIDGFAPQILDGLGLKN